MLYLLKSFGPVGRVIYKVGYARDMDSRFQGYVGANPFIEKLSVSPGELLDEKVMHLWLHSILPETLRDEWYFCESTERMIDLFGRLPEAKSWVWDSRESLRINPDLWKHLYRPGLPLMGYDYRLLWSIRDPVAEGSLDPGFLGIFLGSGYDFVARLRAYCDYRDSHPSQTVDLCRSVIIPPRYHSYYDLGRDTLSACSYQESKIKAYLETSGIFGSLDLREAVLKEFSGVTRITKAEAKERLAKVYAGMGLMKTAKATDLKEFYNITEINMTVSGKRQMGFKLESK